MCKVFVGLVALIVFFSSPVSANNDTINLLLDSIDYPKLSVQIHNYLKPKVANEHVCKDVPQLDKTGKVDLNEFKIGRESSLITISANVKVTCKTSDSAFIKASASEDFAINGKFDVATCTIVDFSASPRGDIGKAIARGTDFSNKIKMQVEQNLDAICP